MRPGFGNPSEGFILFVLLLIAAAFLLPKLVEAGRTPLLAVGIPVGGFLLLWGVAWVVVSVRDRKQ